MDPMDLDFSFDDVDVGWHCKASTDALANMVAAKKTPLMHLESSASQASGRQTSGTHEALYVQQAKAQVAIEDAKEKGKLQINRQEAVMGNAGMICNTKKDSQGIATNCCGQYALQPPGRAHGCNGAVHCPTE